MAARNQVLALIAHDMKKTQMVEFARLHREALAAYTLIATASTGALLIAEVGLEVEQVLSGPQGGDLQIAARIAMHEVHKVIFLIDPLAAHPHDPDIQAIQRVCVVHNVPLATNVATARLIV